MKTTKDAGDVAWLKAARKKPLQYRPLEDYLAARRAAEQGIAAEEALKAGMEQKAREFVEKGSEIYAKT
jgi:hypothetical protein